MLIQQVVIGHMMSGKTKLGFKQFNNLKTKEKCVWIKLTLNKDCNLKKTIIYTHDTTEEPIEGYLCNDINLLATLTNDYNVFFIDECHFLTEEGYAVLEKLLKNKTVYCFGLDMDYMGKPFSIMGYLCCLAVNIIKKHETCSHGKRLDFTYKIAEDNNRLSEDVGQYIPMCRECYFSKNHRCI